MPRLISADGITNQQGDRLWVTWTKEGLPRKDGVLFMPWDPKGTIELFVLRMGAVRLRNCSPHSSSGWMLKRHEKTRVGYPKSWLQHPKLLRCNMAPTPAPRFKGHFLSALSGGAGLFDIASRDAPGGSNGGGDGGSSRKCPS